MVLVPTYTHLGSRVRTHELGGMEGKPMILDLESRILGKFSPKVEDSGDRRSLGSKTADLCPEVRSGRRKSVQILVALIL